MKNYKMTHLTTEVETEIIKQAKNYNEDQYDLFIAEQGWQDWMNDYTVAEEGKQCSESEIKEIEKEQLRLWKKAQNI